MIMGDKTMAIHLRSYFKPNQKEGSNSRKPIDCGLKQTTVAILNAVKIIR
jgi:hypothetical protein